MILMSEWWFPIAFVITVILAFITTQIINVKIMRPRGYNESLMQRHIRIIYGLGKRFVKRILGFFNNE